MSSGVLECGVWGDSYIRFVRFGVSEVWGLAQVWGPSQAVSDYPRFSLIMILLGPHKLIWGHIRASHGILSRSGCSYWLERPWNMVYSKILTSRFWPLGVRFLGVKIWGTRFGTYFKNGKKWKSPFLRVRKKWVPGVLGNRSWMGFAGPRKLSIMRIVSGRFKAV